MGTIVTLLAALPLGRVTFVVVFLGGMRAKWPAVVDAVQILVGLLEVEKWLRLYHGEHE